MLKNVVDVIRGAWCVKKSRITHHVSRSFIVLIFFLTTSCQSAPPVVKIGLVAPFEGKLRGVGYDVIYSTRLSVREINAAGGANGVRIALIALDDGGDPNLARQAAASLVIDPDVVAVIGHWQPETTEAARAIYEEAGLSVIEMGSEPFGVIDPVGLPASFLQNYANITPGEEVAGIYAGTAYDAMQLLYAGISQTEGTITRTSLAETLQELQIEGITGIVYQP